MRLANDRSSGNWVWSDGSQPTFQNFEENDGGQRVNVPGQPYLLLRPSSGEWQFDPDSEQYASLCVKFRRRQLLSHYCFI